MSKGDDLADRILTNELWNDISQEKARAANHYFISYCSSKKESELAVWKFVEAENPSFGVTVFLPALIFGPPIQAVKKPISKGINMSNGILYDLFNGDNAEIPATIFPSWIDVRDLAVAHVKSLTAPAARNKRFLIGGFPLTNTALAKTIGDLAGKGALPRSVLEKLAKEGEADRHTPVPKIEAAEATRALDMTFRTMEEMVKDTVEKILELEARE